MLCILISLVLLLLSGCAALLNTKRPAAASLWGAGGALAATVPGCIPAFRSLIRGISFSADLPWDMPLGAIAVGMDRLSAFFLVPVFILCALAGIYGTGYLKKEISSRSVAASWFFFNLLFASMILVCIARNGLLFLVAWEGMSLSSFFLVAFEHEKGKVRKAAWTYLVATTLSAMFLLPMFLLLGKYSGSLNFSGFRMDLSSGTADLIFILALIGFGTKAGMMPFHIWLPEAHPEAPSHVSAVMSGVMIKTGIYGLVRILAMMPGYPLWWGCLFIGLGSVSAVLGVLYALTQHDLKRLLAYSSVENIGIILLGIGTGLVGMGAGMPATAILGIAGALFHVISHAFFKGILFLGAGSVLHATGQREMDRLGGLFRRMPGTGTAFLVGSAAVSGIPPLNGFIGEFLVFSGAFHGILGLSGKTAVPMAVTVVSLALTGGLAIACFTKAFGIVFLGESRSDQARNARESGRTMVVPMWILSALCILLGLFGWAAAQGVVSIAQSTFGIQLTDGVLQSLKALRSVGDASICLAAAFSIAFALRHFLLSRRKLRKAVTWDCGYSFPSPKMQYTASSFTQPLVDLFHPVLKTKKLEASPKEFFPAEIRFESETPDLGKEGLFEPVFTGIESFLSKFRKLQQGKSQVYVLYMVLALLFLLLTRLR